ncbi:MAG TPA: hypothetical protein VNF50_08275 [Acidimicrobiales bacterium]|nr:hypothetical protein [Acidimicrobiales bacterium]
MPVIEAPVSSADEVLGLVYAKVAARRRNRRRRAVIGSSGTMVLVAGLLSLLLLGAGGSASHQATYALPAGLPAGQRHQVLASLESRYQGFGLSHARTSLRTQTVTVAWSGGRSSAPRVVAQLGGAGDLSLRPVLGTHRAPCRTTPSVSADTQAFEAPGPAGSGQCLELGPAEMTGLRFYSTRAVHGASGWAVGFVVAGPDAAVFDQVGLNNQGRAVAILVDNRVLSDPVVHNPNFAGRGLISGRFDQARAEALALALRYRLPVSLGLLGVD